MKSVSKVKKNKQLGKDRHPDQEWIDKIVGQQHCTVEEAVKQIEDAKLAGMTLKGWLEFNQL